MTKPFEPLTAEVVDALPGQLGVFELADEAGTVRLIGYAGGRSPFGIRSELRPYVGAFASFRTEAALAKLVASEAGSRVVDRAIQIHVGIGVTKDLPLERWYREMRIRRIGEGPSEVQRIVVARDLLGKAMR